MPISKKDRRSREQKEKAANGTLAPTTKAGHAAKPAKEKVTCKICKIEIEKEKTVFLKDHAEAKHPKNAYSDCWPAA